MTENLIQTLVDLGDSIATYQFHTAGGNNKEIKSQQWELSCHFEDLANELLERSAEFDADAKLVHMAIHAVKLHAEADREFRKLWMRLKASLLAGPNLGEWMFVDKSHLDPEKTKLNELFKDYPNLIQRDSNSRVRIRQTQIRRWVKALHWEKYF